MNKTIFTLRQHPLAMFRNIFRYILLLPVFLYSWPTGLLGVALCCQPIIAWITGRFSLTSHAFHLQSGFLFQRETIIQRQHISTLSVERPLYLRLFHAARIYLDTDESGRKRASLKLLVSNAVADYVLEQQNSQAKQPLVLFSPRVSSVVWLSLLISDSLSGVVLLATTLYQVGRVVGRQHAHVLIDNLELAANRVYFFPRAAAILGIILLLGWCIASGRNLLNNLPFHVSRHRYSLSFSAGWLNRRAYSCTVRSINYLDIRQTLLSKALRLSIGFIHCVGYGRSQGLLALFLPAMSSTKLHALLSQFLPEIQQSPISILPSRRALWRYMRTPFLIIVTLYPIAKACTQIFPMLQDVIIVLAGAGYIPCLWLLTVRAVEYHTAGISCGNGCYTIRYARRFTFHTLVIPHNKVVMLQFRQSLFQRRGNALDVYLYTISKTSCRHRIRGLPSAEIRKLFNQNLKGRFIVWD